MRKYKDAINWGAKRRGEKLSSKYKDRLEEFLGSYQRKTASAKKDGMMTTHEADAITFELFELINRWALEDGNILALCWTSTQWNCMGRCGSIDPLGFCNFRVIDDAHAVTYDSSKMDQEGKKCFPKHIYANHENLYMCQWTHMGLFFMTKSERLGRTDKLFLEEGNEEGTAAKKYNEQLAGIVTKTEERREILKLYCREDHFKMLTVFEKVLRQKPPPELPSLQIFRQLPIAETGPCEQSSTYNGSFSQFSRDCAPTSPLSRPYRRTGIFQNLCATQPSRKPWKPTMAQSWHATKEKNMIPLACCYVVSLALSTTLKQLSERSKEIWAIHSWLLTCSALSRTCRHSGNLSPLNQPQGSWWSWLGSHHQSKWPANSKKSRIRWTSLSSGQGTLPNSYDILTHIRLQQKFHWIPIL